MDDKPYKGFVIWHLLWSNLGVRPLRSALSILALSLQVFLVLLIVGLTTGALSDWRTRAEGVGADIIVQPPNSSIFFAFSSAVMPETLVDKIDSLPGVDEVAPVLIVVDQRNFGDPFAGHPKDFRVTWRCGPNLGNKVMAYPPIKEGQGRSVLLTCP